MLLDILKNEESELKKRAEEASPLSVEIKFRLELEGRKQGIIF